LVAARGALACRQGAARCRARRGSRGTAGRVTRRLRLLRQHGQGARTRQCRAHGEAFGSELRAAGLAARDGSRETRAGAWMRRHAFQTLKLLRRRTATARAARAAATAEAARRTTGAAGAARASTAAKAAARRTARAAASAAAAEAAASGRGREQLGMRALIARRLDEV